MRPTRVTVCVATYRRPAGLDRLLASLTGVDLSEGVEMRVVVLDNDEERSAHAVVSRYTTRLSDLHYAIEPKRGISRARNRLVVLALDASEPPDYVAFVDDDEWVDFGWLRAFLACASRMNAVLAGPVLPSYERRVPAWIRDGGFFERTPRSSGSEAPFAGAGNLLIPCPLLVSLDAQPPFAEIFDRPGGEDAFFSVLAKRYGYQVRWCDEARVHEEVSRDRGSVRWVVRRAFNGGYDYSRVVRLTRSSRTELAGRVASGVGHICVGVVLLLPALVRGRRPLLHAVRRCAAGAGALAGLVDPLPGAVKRTAA
jgi:glycosyltransferase involved in cell wall biosynthesis